MANKNGGPDEHLSADGKIRPCEAPSEDSCRAGKDGESAIPVPPNMTDDQKEAWRNKTNVERYGNGLDSHRKNQVVGLPEMGQPWSIELLDSFPSEKTTRDRVKKQTWIIKDAGDKKILMELSVSHQTSRPGDYSGLKISAFSSSLRVIESKRGSDGYSIHSVTPTKDSIRFGFVDGQGRYSDKKLDEAFEGARERLDAILDDPQLIEVTDRAIKKSHDLM